MDTPHINRKSKKQKPIEFFKMLPNVVKTIEKPTWVAITVLILVWFSGRLLETLNGNPVFDSFAAYWLGITMCLLMILLAIIVGIRCFEAIRNAESKKLVAFSWLGLFVVVALTVTSMDGIQVSATGLLAAAAGAAEPARNAVFLLMKYHSFNPMLAVNLVAQMMTPWALDIAALASFVWNWNILFFMYVWSFAFGIAMMVRQGMALAKTLHLVAATAGLVLLLFLRSKSLVTTEYMVVFQAGVLMVLLWQLLLVYASLRQTAAAALAVHANKDMPFGETRKTHRPKCNYRGLPPSAITIALAMLFVTPILADFNRQVQDSRYGNRLAKEMGMAPSTTDMVLVSVAPVSIRSGPSLGDEILGVLPEGTRIRVHDIKFNWVNMGKNNWVPEKFLRPVIGKEHISKAAKNTKKAS